MSEAIKLSVEESSDTVSEDTQKVLDQLKAEGNEIEGQPSEAPKEEPVPSKEETVVEEPEEPQEETPDETREPVDRSQKEPALIPAWEHKVAEKRWLKEKEALEAQLQQLQQNPTTENREAVQHTAGNLRELASQYGLELDEAQEKFFSDLLRRAVPEDMTKKLAAIERDRQVSFLEQQFDGEFQNDIMPLVEGRGLDSRQLAELKTKLHDAAFTETYAKVPLKKVFLAEQASLTLPEAGEQKTVASAKSGKGRAATTDFDSVDEDTLQSMSPEEVERYTEHMIQKAGGRAWR